MADFVYDTFTGSSGAITSRSGELGASWTLATGYAIEPQLTGTGYVQGGSTTARAAYASGVPASADYSVEGGLYVSTATYDVFLAARFATDANTLYGFGHSNGAGWRLQKWIAGSGTILGTAGATALTVGQTYVAKIDIVGDQINCYVDGVKVLGPITDTSIADAGRAGLRMRGSNMASYWFDYVKASEAGGGGGTTYDEPLAATLTSVTSLDDRQTYLEAAAVLIQAGASAGAVITMMEQVVALGQAETAATGLLTLAEQTLATIQSAATLADAVAAAETLAVTITSQTTVADSQASQGAEDLLVTVQGVTSIADVATAVETLLATIQSATGVTDTIGGSPQTYPETLLVAATVAAEAGAAQSMVEGLTAVAQGEVSVVDFRGYLEQVAATAQAIDSVSDRHLMIDNVTIMALSGAGLGEIGSYLEQLATAATSGASVTDVLVGSFIGRYLFLDTLPLRSFTDRLPARSFIDTPRGRA